jgi:hypothetical protein
MTSSSRVVVAGTRRQQRLQGPEERAGGSRLGDLERTRGYWCVLAELNGRVLPPCS